MRSAITTPVKDHLLSGLESENMKRRISTADVGPSEDLDQTSFATITAEEILELWC